MNPIKLLNICNCIVALVLIVSSNSKKSNKPVLLMSAGFTGLGAILAAAASNKETSEIAKKTILSKFK